MIGELRHATCHQLRWQSQGARERSYRNGAVDA